MDGEERIEKQKDKQMEEVRKAYTEQSFFVFRGWIVLRTSDFVKTIW